MFGFLKSRKRKKHQTFCVEVLSEESKKYFLDSVREDIVNHHINGDCFWEYYKIADAYCTTGHSKLFLDEAKEIAVSIFVLRLRDFYIGCSMIYQFPDYVEFMYIHISAEYRNRGYGMSFYEILESCVQPPAVMKIRCYETSPEGINLAQKAGYELGDVSNHNTKTFLKMKR